jgi:hypothetical protein
MGPEAGGVLISGGKTIEITSVTIVGNSSGPVGAAPTGAGGILSSNGAQVVLRNTVVAANTGNPLDCSGELLSLAALVLVAACTASIEYVVDTTAKW